MRYKKRPLWIRWKLILLLLIAMTLTGFSPTSTEAEEKNIQVNLLQQTGLGELSKGRYTLKAQELIMEPGAEIPPHQHKGPGIRYVVEGAITISWIGGQTQTFEAGSTYFEGSGKNHPARTFSAKNAGPGRCRVLIMELIPTR